jgi:hypothetical protein
VLRVDADGEPGEGGDAVEGRERARRIEQVRIFAEPFGEHLDGGEARAGDLPGWE